MIEKEEKKIDWSKPDEVAVYQKELKSKLDAFFSDNLKKLLRPDLIGGWVSQERNRGADIHNYKKYMDKIYQDNFKQVINLFELLLIDKTKFLKLLLNKKLHHNQVRAINDTLEMLKNSYYILGMKSPFSF